MTWVGRSLPVVLAVGSLVLSAASSASPRSRESTTAFVLETLSLDSHESPNDGVAGPVSTTGVLASGTSYLITVDGTWSTWDKATWDNPGSCGSSEPAPENPSPGVTNGPVSADAEFFFAEAAWGGHDCNSEFPRHYADPFVFDIGSGFVHQEPIGGVPSAPSSAHEYQYRVTGQGQPARFQLVDDPSTDNYGILRITVAEEGGGETVLTPRGCIDDNDTGPEDCAESTDGLGRVRSIAISSDGKSVYTVSEDDYALVGLERDTTTGVLTPQECINDNDSGGDTCAQSADGLDHAIEVAISPDGESVYTTAYNDDAVAMFDRNTTTGALTPMGCIDDPVSGNDTCGQTTYGLDFANAVAFSPDGRSVYVAGLEDDSLVIFERDADGDLAPQGCIDDNDTGPDPCAQSTDGLDGPRSVTVSPDGKSVYVASFVDDAVVYFDRNTASGALTPRGCVDDNDSGADTCAQSTDGLDGSHSVTVSQNGESVYAAGAYDDAVVSLRRNTTSGTLTPQGCVDDNDTGSDDCARTTDALDNVTWLAPTPDGRAVLATANIDHSVVVFARNASTGALTPAGCIDDNDTGPDDCADSTDGLDGAIFLAVSPDGQSAYVTSYLDDAIVHFDVNSEATDQPPQCGDPGAICGGSGDEDLDGTPEDEFIFGGGGNDDIDGGGGNDVIVGGTGNDVISGGPGKDKITGGDGKDRIVGDAARSSSPVAMRAGLVAAQQAAAPDQLSGGGGNDSVAGGGGSDKVAGGTGEDKILGEAGNDKLIGDAGNDLLKGGGGVNNFNGGPGKDHCVLDNKKDDTRSCEKKTLNFTLNFWPLKHLRTH